MNNLNKRYINKLPISAKENWRGIIRGFILDHSDNNFQEFAYFDFSDDIYTVHRLWSSRNNFSKRVEGIEIIYIGDPFNMEKLYEQRSKEMFG